MEMDGGSNPGAEQMKQTLLCASVLMLMLFLNGCGESRASQASQDSQPVEIKTVAELASFRGVDSLGYAITWHEGALDKRWADVAGAEQVVRATISASSTRLAALDYTPLS